MESRACPPKRSLDGAPHDRLQNYLIPQISNPDAHVVQQAVGCNQGNGHSQHRVDDGEGINAAVAAEHFAEEEGAD